MWRVYFTSMASIQSYIQPCIQPYLPAAYLLFFLLSPHGLDLVLYLRVIFPSLISSRMAFYRDRGV